MRNLSAYSIINPKKRALKVAVATRAGARATLGFANLFYPMAGFLPLTINAFAGKLSLSLIGYCLAASATACFTIGS